MGHNKRYHPTKAHKKLFRKTCEKWIDRFSLNDFKVYYDTEDLDSAYGACIADLPGQVVSLILADPWDEKITDEMVISTARHEVLELLLQPLWHAVLCRELNVDWASSQRHSAIRRLEAAFDKLEV